MKICLITASAIAKMKTWLIAASAFGGIFASDIIRLSALILKKNMGINSMPEYIERESVIKSLLNDAPEQVGYSREDAADCILFMDAADVAPVRHGRWVTTSGEVFPGSSQFLCYSHKHEECGFQYIDMGENEYDFCPHCGAKMDGE